MSKDIKPGMGSIEKQKYYIQPELWGNEPEPYQHEVLRDILNLIPGDVESILDIGCGDGLITNQLAEKVFTVGLDISREALKYVKAEKLVGSITDLPLSDKSFDLVMANDILEHLDDDSFSLALRELGRVARKYVIVTVPFMENLEEGMTVCPHCGTTYHVNYHHRAFDIKTLRSLFNARGFNCVLQALSGAEWTFQHQSRVAINQALGIYAASGTTLCPNCGKTGGDKVTLKTDVPGVERLNAAAAANDPEYYDNSVLRTECISMFSRNSVQNILDAGYLDSEFKPVSIKRQELNTSEIDFAFGNIYEKPFLVDYGRLPYYLVNDKYKLNSEGIHLGDGADIKMGFFVEIPESNNSKIRIQGFADDEVRLVISVYHHIRKTYVQAADVRLSGEFDYAVEYRFPVISRYGHLISIVPQGGNVLINKCTITGTDGKTRTFGLNKPAKARFRNISRGDNILVSLPLYGDWVPEPAWMDNPFEISRGAYNKGFIENVFDSESKAAQIEYESEITQTDAEMQRIQAELVLKKSELTQKDIELQSTHSELDNTRNELHKSILDLDSFRKANEGFRSEMADMKSELARTRIARDLRTGFKGAIREIFGWNAAVINAAVVKESMSATLRCDVPEKLDFVMICHDQNIDRRILQQAHSLEKAGKKGLLVALSHDQEDHADVAEGLPVHRIGLKRIIPFYSRIYNNYNKRMFWIGNNRVFRKLRLTNLMHRLNNFYYKMSLIPRFRKPCVTFPLPFDHCFYVAAKQYPAGVVFAHDLPALKTATRLAGEWGAKLAYDAHELYYEQKVFLRSQKKMMRKIELEYLPKCDAAFTVNQSIAEEMGKRYNCPAPNVLLNAVDRPEGFSIDKKYDFFREHFSISEDTLILLFQGGLSPGRNIENIIRAMSFVSTPNIVLVIMGNGGIKENLQNIAAKAPAGKVLFKEAVPQDELIEWSASADIGIVPYPHIDLNTYFCTPNKLFEFMQAGVPMIANDLPELRRFVKDTGFGIVGPMTSPQNIASLIDKFASDKTARETARKALLQRACDYSWAEQSKKYLEIMMKLYSEGSAE